MPHLHDSHKVVVLGAGGKVGRMLSKYWQRSPPNVINPVFQTSGSMPDAIQCGCVRWRLDDDPSPFLGARTMVVLWGVTPGDAQPMSQNTTLALSALKTAAEIGVKRVLLASSAAVYSGAKGGRHAEDDALSPPYGAYGQAKLAMEQAARQWADGRITPRLSLLRLANVIGADSLFANLQLSGEVQLDRFASGAGPQRSYLAVEDLARVIEVLATCADTALPQVINVAGQRALAMADLVARAGGRVVWRPAPPVAIERVELDTERLQNLTGPLEISSDPERAITSWQHLWVQP